MAQASFSAPGVPRGARTNPPVYLTSFVGHERDLVELRQLLADVRLLTLTGTGGVGKTRLALRVASDLLPELPDGAPVVELAALYEARLVPHAVAAVLDVREQPHEPVQVSLSQALHARQLLLILDNCEHLAEACADLVEDLLRGCPRLKVLATSRQPLGVAGETVWRVPSLAVPDLQVASGADEILACEAVRLFVERSKLVAPGFVLSDRNAATVARICQRLDGIPLAIEVAAARVSVLGLDQILARLDDRFALLEHRGRRLPDRHRTLRAAIDWSYYLLAEGERVLLRRLSVFAGGWTLEAAEEVCARPGLASEEVLGRLTTLVDHSLIVVDGQESIARYHLLETIRQYSAEKLRDLGEAVEMRDKHLNWYVELAERADFNLSGPGQAAALAIFDREQDNVRAALGWSLDAGRLEVGLRLANACAYFWEIRGHRYRAEGRGWLEQLLTRGEGQGDNPSSTVRARALLWAGTFAAELFDFGRAEARLGASLLLFQELSDEHGAAESLLNLGAAARVRGNYEQAESALERSLALMRSIDDRLGVANVLRQRGRVAHDVGRGDDAERWASEALRIYRDLSEWHQAGHAYDQLGEAACEQRQFERAAERYSQATQLLRQAGCEEGETSTLYHEARLAHAQDDAERARTLCLNALRVMEGRGVRREVGFALELLAIVTVHEHPQRAARLLGAAENVRAAVGIALPPLDRDEHQRALSAARVALSAAAFEQAWESGRAMSSGEVVTFALADAVEPAAVSSRPSPLESLTTREREVTLLVARGFTNREIAATLVIAERTVESHVTHVLVKLALRSRAQLAVWAVEHGLLHGPGG